MRAKSRVANGIMPVFLMDLAEWFYPSLLDWECLLVIPSPFDKGTYLQCKPLLGYSCQVYYFQV